MPEREKFIKAIERAKKQSEKYGLCRIMMSFEVADMIISMLKEQKNIIRCKDCYYYLGNGFCFKTGIHLKTNDEWFCAEAEHKRGR